jgi:CheY-like chemotaxis protein
MGERDQPTAGASRMAPRQAPKAGAARRRRPVESVPDNLGHGRRVLVVEDERMIRRSIAGYLEDVGYLVDQAENGVEGLERMRQVTPDVVVLDLLMPLMGGREFIQTCRLDLRLVGVPIVLLSAAHDMPQVAAELQPRASQAKPIDLDVLLAVVDRVSRT